MWTNGQDPPLEKLQRWYREIVSDELKVRAEGVPEKQGWARTFDLGRKNLERQFVMLVDGYLAWYKSAPGKNLRFAPNRLICIDLYSNESLLRGRAKLGNIRCYRNDSLGILFIVAETDDEELEVESYRRVRLLRSLLN